MRQSPTEAEQPIELRAHSRGVDDVAPRDGTIESAADLARFPMSNLIRALLVAFRASRAFCEIQNNTRRSTFDLIGEIAVVLMKHGDDWLELRDELESNLVGSEGLHLIVFS